MSKIKMIISPEHKHWVGDGFNVHTMIHPSPELYAYTNPFILLDYAPGKEFPATKEKLGVGEHPHRGFETVTFAIQGEIEHRDSSGGGGVINAGDIQWMTAADGIVHEEFHSRDFAAKGGILEMVQLWVNLPKEDKRKPAKYQSILNKDCPRVELDKGIEAKIIAGKLNSIQGPAYTFTEINAFEINSSVAGNIKIPLDKTLNCLCLVLRGEANIETYSVTKEQIIIFDHQTDLLEIELKAQSKLLILSGKPIEEPIYSHGPFVMNSKAEIIEAIEDYQNGKMGSL